MGRRYRRRATVTITERPGSEMWFAITTATGRTFCVPAWVSLEEVWRGINEGWSSTRPTGTLRAGERRYSVPMADWVAFEASRRSASTGEPKGPRVAP